MRKFGPFVSGHLLVITVHFVGLWKITIIVVDQADMLTLKIFCSYITRYFSKFYFTDRAGIGWFHSLFAFSP